MDRFYSWKPNLMESSLYTKILIYSTQFRRNWTENSKHSASRTNSDSTSKQNTLLTKWFKLLRVGKRLKFTQVMKRDNKFKLHPHFGFLMLLIIQILWWIWFMNHRKIPIKEFHHLAHDNYFKITYFFLLVYFLIYL